MRVPRGTVSRNEMARRMRRARCLLINGVRLLDDFRSESRPDDVLMLAIESLIIAAAKEAFYYGERLLDSRKGR